MSSASVERIPGGAASELRARMWPWFVGEFFASYGCNLYINGCFDWAYVQYHATPSDRLWLNVVWGVAYIAISLMGGKVSERWGPRRASLVMTGLTGGTALLGLLAVAVPASAGVGWGLVVLGAVMLPYNLTCTMIWPAVESGVTRTAGEMRLSARLAVFNLSWGGAGFLAMFTHGMLEQTWFGWIFIVSGVASWVATFILGRWGPRGDQLAAEHVPDDPESEHELDDPAMRKRAQKMLIMAWVSNGLIYLPIYVIIPLITQLVFLAGVDKTNLTAAGIIGSLWYVVRFGGFALTWKWTSWHYKAGWLIAPVLTLGASFFGMLMIHDLTVLVALQVVFGLSAALVYSAALYYAMHVSSGHGGHAGIHEAIVGIGTTGGPLIGALAGMGEMDAGAMHRIGIGTTGIMAIGIIVVLWMASRLNQGEGKAESERA